MQKRKTLLNGLTNGNLAPKEEMEKILKRNSNQLKGVRTFMTIVTFTLIYRYLAPVLITPVANKIGNWLNAKIDAKQAEKENIETAQQNQKVAA